MCYRKRLFSCIMIAFGTGILLGCFLSGGIIAILLGVGFIISGILFFNRF